MTRKSEKDWIEAGFSALLDVGREGLAAERLAARLGVTRGSFYHHFGSASGYAHALLTEWQRRSTEQVIAFSRDGGTVDQQAHRLNAAVLGVHHNLDVAIRAWAFRDKIAQSYQAQVDALRISYLKEIYTELLGDKRAAQIASEVVYLSFVGLQQVYPHAPKSRWEAMINEARATVMGGAASATVLARRTARVKIRQSAQARKQRKK